MVAAGVRGPTSRRPNTRPSWPTLRPAPGWWPGASGPAAGVEVRLVDVLWGPTWWAEEDYTVDGRAGVVTGKMRCSEGRKWSVVKEKMRCKGKRKKRQWGGEGIAKRTNVLYFIVSQFLGYLWQVLHCYFLVFRLAQYHQCRIKQA